MSQSDFLVELGTEELPPKALKKLQTSFEQSMLAQLKEANLSFDQATAFAAPRRLALLVSKLDQKQPDRVEEVFGPPVKASFDANGEPTKAALGFARKHSVDVSELDRSGEKLRLNKEISGQHASELLPEMVSNALKALPIPKRMRWGSSRVEFVRPTQWLIMLLGEDVIDCTILGQQAGRVSYGHRFHHPQAITINHGSEYQDALHRAQVIADFGERRRLVESRVNELARSQQGKAIMPADLLDEVTALVEWPVPLVCTFEERFLAVPQEALILTMQDNQKYFCLLDDQGRLLPRFVTVANLDSKAPEYIVAGNEKVVRPRLNDAEFFYEQDKKVRLDSFNERLKNVVFQQELGSLYDKAMRLADIATFIAQQTDSDPILARRAGVLSKCDLATEMVGEFPELQGIMGTYYARHSSESNEVALALNEQYLPRFAGDELPQTATGQALAVADKLDTLIGILGLGKHPTGDKDPFGLRRAALGVLRILIGCDMPLDLEQLADQAIAAYGTRLSNSNIKADFMDFMNGRYQPWFVDEGISVDVVKAVLAVKPTEPLDFYRRVQAVLNFKGLPEAQALAAANKRVSNILAKRETAEPLPAVNESLLELAEERALFTALQQYEQQQLTDYAAKLAALAGLKTPIDAFFDKVMVNVDEPAVKNNRLSLLDRLHQHFLAIADIAELQ